MSDGNIAYCTMTPVLTDTTTPGVQVGGFIMAPGGTVLELGSSGDYGFDVTIPLIYLESLETLKAQVMPAVQSTYVAPDLEARVVVLPFLD